MREEDIALYKSFINLFENTIEGTEKKQEVLWRDVHKVVWRVNPSR